MSCVKFFILCIFFVLLYLVFMAFTAVLLELEKSSLIDFLDIRNFILFRVFWNSVFIIEPASTLQLSSRNLLLLLNWLDTLSGQRQSWQRERATLDQQMYTYIFYVKMSHIVLPIFSHHKTNPTSSHPLGQIVQVFKIYTFGKVLVSHGAGTQCNEKPSKWSWGEDDIQT